MSVNEEYPLYPDLTEQGEIEAQEIIDKFRIEVKKILTDTVEETMGKIYCDIIPYIQSDSWTNFRNDLLDGFKNYHNSKVHAEWDFKKIREEIYKEYRDDIIKDLDQDNLKRIEELEKQVKWLEDVNRNRCY